MKHYTRATQTDKALNTEDMWKHKACDDASPRKWQDVSIDCSF
jgi:hypothetical protein